MPRFALVLLALALMAGPTLLLHADAPATAPAPAASQPAPTPQVVLLQLVKPVDAQNKALVASDDRFSGYTGELNPGIRIVLQIAMPPDVVEVPNSITLSTFVDDKGTDLGFGVKAKDSSSPNPTPPIQLSADHSQCFVKLYSSTLPSHEASEIHIKGKLPIRLGRGEKMFTQKNFLFRLGKTVEAGPITLTLASLAESYRDRNAPAEGLSVGFTSEKPLNLLKSLTFLDGDNKTIALTQETRTNNPDNYNHLAGISGTLSHRLHSATVHITTYETIENLDIPLDLTIKVGL